MAQAVHDWAAHGGSGAGNIDLAIGPSTLHAAGDVAFDAKVQPQGHASLNADHLDAFTGAIIASYPQVQDTVSAMEARLSPYLSSTPHGGQTLSFKATYGNGAVMVNGRKSAACRRSTGRNLETRRRRRPRGTGQGRRCKEEGSSCFLKKAAQKLLLNWAGGAETSTAQISKVFLLLFVHKK